MMLLQTFASNNNITTEFYRVYIWQVLALLCAAAKRCLMNSIRVYHLSRNIVHDTIYRFKSDYPLTFYPKKYPLKK